MIAFRAWVPFIGASMCFAASALGDNLILNGSFEDGQFQGDPSTSWNYVPPGGTAVTGWVGTLDGFDWHQTVEFSPAFDGHRMVDLSGGGVGGIAQTFGTVPGTQYILTFSLAGPNRGFQNPRAVHVDVAGISQLFTAPASDPIPLEWTVQTMTFTAVGDSTTLQFRGNGTGEYWGPVIDGVSVATVPAPATAGLLGLGAVALRRRRR